MPLACACASEPNYADEAGAAALLLGTAIGGGFLATPHATAPAGALPSISVLSACWLFLLVESWLVADLVIDEHEQTGEAADDLAGTTSFASLGRRAFGPVGGAAVSCTFLVLMMATLVSQLAKASILLPAVGPLPASLQCALLAGTLAGLASCAPLRAVTLTNGALTLGFLASAGVLLGGMLPSAEWTRLVRADWSRAASSIPTLLQLHVYAEIVPSVSEALGHSRTRVRRALLVGSLLLLAVQIGWSTIGLAAIPYDGAAAGLRTDPVDALLSRGGTVAAATAAAGATAVATTILGTARALYTFCVDAFRQSAPVATADQAAEAAVADGVRGLRAQWPPASTLAFVSLMALPTLIASRAGAAAAFFGAIDFAGAYPVALLWGLAPPLMCLRLRGSRLSPRKRAALAALAALAAAFVAVNFATDVSALLGLRGARWQ